MQAQPTPLQERELEVLELTLDLGSIGPTDVHEHLRIPVSTSHRILRRLEADGYLKAESGGQHRRFITDKGREACS